MVAIVISNSKLTTYIKDYDYDQNLNVSSEFMLLFIRAVQSSQHSFIMQLGDGFC